MYHIPGRFSTGSLILLLAVMPAFSAAAFADGATTDYQLAVGLLALGGTVFATIVTFLLLRVKRPTPIARE